MRMISTFPRFSDAPLKKRRSLLAKISRASRPWRDASFFVGRSAKAIHHSRKLRRIGEELFVAPASCRQFLVRAADQSRRDAGATKYSTSNT